MITNEDFRKATIKFDETEKRGSFYNISVNLLYNGFETEAYILLLATWNFGCFR